MDGFRGTDVNTGLAIDTHVLVNLRFLVLYRNCRCWTFIHAGFTGGAFFFIDDCYQNRSLHRIYTTKDKKGFRYSHVGYCLLSPRTSFMPYKPGFLPITQRVARSAPLAKTERSYARCESSMVSKFFENITL